MNALRVVAMSGGNDATRASRKNAATKKANKPPTTELSVVTKTKRQTRARSSKTAVTKKGSVKIGNGSIDSTADIRAKRLTPYRERTSRRNLVTVILRSKGASI